MCGAQKVFHDFSIETFWNSMIFPWFWPFFQIPWFFQVWKMHFSFSRFSMIFHDTGNPDDDDVLFTLQMFHWKDPVETMSDYFLGIWKQEMIHYTSTVVMSHWYFPETMFLVSKNPSWYLWVHMNYYPPFENRLNCIWQYIMLSNLQCVCIREKRSKFRKCDNKCINVQ